MGTKDLVNEVLSLKRERNAVILAHNYMDYDIQVVADFIGDSYDLALRAMETRAEVIVFAGVRFMAEQAKALNYDRIVLAPDLNAGCTIADALDVDTLRRVKEEYPNAPVVLYVNSNADVKALADYIVTSSTAVKVIKKLSSDVVIFGPDSNLADYVAHLTGKRIIKVPPNGKCIVHGSYTVGLVKETRARYPRARVMIHPEAPLEVLGLADFVGSTNQMIEYARNSGYDEFVVGTEIGMLNALRLKVPNKTFYPITTEPYARCPFMAMVTLEKVRRSLRDLVHRIEIPRSTAEAIRDAFERTRRLLEG
ncbi:quinolinate synthetase complex, A subunit [Vulcanisaeta distributa DSM 14429]|uniref:Quinolinate synthase n=2 Tax=Vulcanisaeta distributa TaxID=164451 RepID=E1QUG4_VULDI|nr:quinolinate synthase NadA [Vulcanisaeta distributa]ADN49890.1 quinolinate synthetase complex, A subunit [Vulcanisaeta distributa DSM 14429]